MATVKALQWHTYNGTAYDVGATYDAPDELLDTLKVQGKAVPVADAPATVAVELSGDVAPKTPKAKKA